MRSCRVQPFSTPAFTLLAALAVAGLLATASAQASPTEAGPPGIADADRLAREHPAFGPALAWRSPVRLSAEAALAETLREADRTASGLSTTLRWRPTVSWRTVAGNEGGWQMDRPRWPLSLDLRWMHDPVAQARASLQLFQAEGNLAQRVHRDLRDALSLYIDLHRAHVTLTLAEQALATQAIQAGRTEEVAMGEGAGLGDEPASTTLAAGRLALERAKAAVERAAHDLAEAERRAAALGIDLEAARWAHGERSAPLALEGWRLHLPLTDPLHTPAVQRALIDLELARATAQRRLGSGPLDDLWLRAEGGSGPGRLSTVLRLDEGRPRVDLGVELGGSSRAGWSVQVGALLVLSDADGRAEAQSRRLLQEAEEAWLRAVDEAVWLLGRARQAALDAEADVAFAERALQIARQALAEAVATWHRATAPDVDPSGEHRAAADAALLRLILGLERERDAFYRAWNQYLLEAERYWTASGGWGGVLAPP